MALGGQDLGQHFLVDETAVARLVEAAGLAEGDVVLDAGAGPGALTVRLSEAVGPRGRVLAVEVDPRLAARLRALRLPNVEVVEQDVLEARLPPLDAAVANPPFRLVSPLCFRLLDAGVPRSVLVVPREFAQRLAAPPRTARYGRLTVAMALRAATRTLFPLPPRAFEPPPEVPASVLRLEPRSPPAGVDPALLEAVLEAAWASRRRTLRHGLAPLAVRLRFSSGALTELLRERGWTSKMAPDLSPPEYADLARHVGLLAAR